MSTATQYNPNIDLNRELVLAGGSKTVYALVTPEVEFEKALMFGNHQSIARKEYLEQFRDAWTGKQDAYHREFFDEWHRWSAPVVDLDRDNFPFFYPTAGASEPLRHLIFSMNVGYGGGISKVHFFDGDYEGYKAMAEASRNKIVVHRREDWREVRASMGIGDLFFISQPSAIDGNVWAEFNEFAAMMPRNSIVADVTYVGAVPRRALAERIDLNARSIRNVVFSLSKPFGVYYDRIGGVWCREEDLGLFGNRWFKNLTSLALGTALLKARHVFYLPERYRLAQEEATGKLSAVTDVDLKPSDVFILAHGQTDRSSEMIDYLRRPANGGVRVCLTPAMAAAIGTSGKIE